MTKQAISNLHIFIMVEAFVFLFLTIHFSTEIFFLASTVVTLQGAIPHGFKTATSTGKSIQIASNSVCT